MIVIDILWKLPLGLLFASGAYYLWQLSLREEKMRKEENRVGVGSDVSPFQYLDTEESYDGRAL
jgi:hypothetical protein